MSSEHISFSPSEVVDAIRFRVQTARATLHPTDEFEEALLTPDKEPNPDNKLAFNLSYFTSIGAGAVATGLLTVALGYGITSGNAPTEIKPKREPTASLSLGTGCNIAGEPQLFVNAKRIKIPDGSVALSITGPDKAKTVYTLFTDTDKKPSPINTAELPPTEVISELKPFNAVIPNPLTDMRTGVIEKIIPGEQYQAEIGQALIDPDEGSLGVDHPFITSEPITAATCTPTS